jgi:predicted chitinase
MVTDDELRQIMPNLPAAKRAGYLPFIQQAMAEFDITSYLRETAFLAQLAHESAELRYMEEIASGAAYEGRANLGNTQPGDGKRYKGRGPIQLTGRANYTKYGQLLGLDLVHNPTIAATKEVGFRIAGQYWKLNGLNELADAQNFKLITKRINGGYNGLDDRIKYYERAKRVLNKDDDGTPRGPLSTSPSASSDIARCPNPYLRPGSRGNSVRSLQQRLNDIGYNVSVDGNFGPGTCAAVKACQGKNRLSDDGIVGPKTWAALWAG